MENNPNTQIDGLGCLALWLGMLNKPFNDRVNVGRVLAWDHIAAYFSVSNRFQPPEYSNVIAHNIRTRKNNKNILLYIKEKGRGIIIIFTHIWSVKACLESAPALSILFPNTSRGIPASDALLSKSWSSLLETLRLSGSAASTTYLQTRWKI